MTSWDRLGAALDNLAGPLRRLQTSRILDAWLHPFLADADQQREQATDALLQRFLQTSDLMLRKVFPAALQAYAGQQPTMPFRDVLDALEKVGVIQSADWWEELNDLRNVLTHEYALDPMDRLNALEQLWSRVPQIISAAEALNTDVERRRS